MENYILDIKVFVAEDYVYMSKEDWQKVVKILAKKSRKWSVSEEKEGNFGLLINDKVH